MKIYKYISLVLILFTFISCEDEEQVHIKEAVLKWTGAYARDGCGFFLKIDDKDYKPENENFINGEFKNYPNLPVLVKFIYLERKIPYGCGLTGPHQIDGIKIISIEKI